MQAWRLVESSTVRLEKISRDFSTVITCANNFVKNINEQLSDLDVDILIEEALPQSKRKIKTKIPFDESNIDDTVIRSSEERWEVDVHNVIMDSVVSSIKDRFESHKQLYKDFSCLDPRRFQEFSQGSGVPDKAFDALCEKLGSHVDPALLRLQLTDFVASFQSMSKSLAEEYEGVSEVVGENENENESDFESSTKKTCRCCVCAHSNCFISFPFTARPTQNFI